MANRFIFVLLVLSLVTNMVVCQTFQYSHGWTNGKRNVMGFPSLPDSSNPLNDGFANTEFKRLKMLMHGSADEQPLLIHCDFVDNPKKIFHVDNIVPQLRREKIQNGDQY